MINTSGLIRKENRCPHIPKVKGIYIITDNQSGKSYIGSSGNINMRVANHLSAGHVKGLNYSDCTTTMLDDCRYMSRKQRYALELERITDHNTIYPSGFNKVNPVTQLRFDHIPKEVKVKLKPLPIKAKKKAKPKPPVKPQVFKIVAPYVNVLAKYHS